MEVFPGSNGRTLRMLQEQQDVAAASILRSLFGDGGRIVDPLRMGERISRGAVVARCDMQRLMKILHEVQEPAKGLKPREVRRFGLRLKDLNTTLNHVDDVVWVGKGQHRIIL